MVSILEDADRLPCVHVDSATKTTLEGVDASPICQAPSEIEIPVDASYQRHTSWLRTRAQRNRLPLGRRCRIA